MNVQLRPFDFAQAATRAGMPEVAQRLRDKAAVAGLSRSDVAGAPGSTQGVGGGFSQVMGNALRNVSQAQKNASALQREVAMDNPTVSIEQTMVAMQKAQIGFQATLQVRNKLAQAYSEVMNMQV